MITTRYVREHIDEIKKSLEKRKSDYPIDELIGIDTEWRAAKTELQVLLTKRNKESLLISSMKKEGRDASEKIEEIGRIKEDIEGLEAAIVTYEDRINRLLWNMPNILHESVPYGKDDSENVEIRKWGDTEKRISKTHEEVLEKLGMLEMQKAAEVSGARFYYLMGDMVRLEQALIRFAIDEVSKKGYIVVSPPFMLKKEYYRGATALGDFEELLYKIADPSEAAGRKDYERIESETFLISTSEHAIAAMHAGDLFSGKDLPLKYVGISPCFRREAGAHGKDTKGIFRVHQFYKVEQFIFCRADESWSYFDELLGNSESIYRKLGIPHRVVDICTGDIGTVAAKKNDIEAYMPSQGRYREVVSCSNCTDWQAMRLDIKYDDKDGRHYVHTLNSTAIATTRTMVAIIENYLNDDGSITVPKALVPYMGKDVIK